MFQSKLIGEKFSSIDLRFKCAKFTTIGVREVLIQILTFQRDFFDSPITRFPLPFVNALNVNVRRLKFYIYNPTRTGIYMRLEAIQFWLPPRIFFIRYVYFFITAMILSGNLFLVI